jgi:hypothetical protein
VPIEWVEIGPDRRQPTREAVDRLALSMKEIGLRTPITVRFFDGEDKIDDRFVLVAGGHRLAAAMALGWDEIEAFVIGGEDVKGADVELWEIDENLCRAELTPSETAAAVSRRKEVYEKLHPETKQGATGGTNKGKAKSEVVKIASSVDRFTKDTAKKSGKSERAIQLAARHGKAIGADNLAKITGTSLDKGVELDALAKLPESERAPLIERAAAGEKVSARAQERRGLTQAAVDGVSAALARIQKEDVADPENYRAAFFLHTELARSVAYRCQSLITKVAEFSVTNDIAREARSVAMAWSVFAETVSARHAEWVAAPGGTGVAPAALANDLNEANEIEEQEILNLADLLTATPNKICETILLFLRVDKTKLVLQALDRRLRNVKPDCVHCKGTGFRPKGGVAWQGMIRCDCSPGMQRAASSSPTGDFDDGATATQDVA